MSANDSGSGTGIWGMARLAAPAVVALALAGVALPWILDSGTVHLPAVGVGVSHGSSSAPPAVAKIVVVKPSTATKNSAGTQHHSHPAGTSAVQTQPQSATGSSTGAGSQAATSSVVHHPTHQSPAGPIRTAAPPNPVIKSTPRSQTPPPTTTINGQDERAHGDQSPATTPHHGRALGHQKHAFRAKAAEDKGPPPRGLALGHRNHVQPGQARKENRPPGGLALGDRNHVPPGQAHKHSESHGQSSDDQGQDSQGDDNNAQGNSSHGHHSDEQGHNSHGQNGDASPGHSGGSQGADSHGRGHGH